MTKFNSVVLKKNNYYSEVVLYNSKLTVHKEESDDIVEKWNDFIKYFNEHCDNLDKKAQEVKKEVASSDNSDECFTVVNGLKIENETGEVLRDYNAESRARAKRRVMEYARNNKWSHFCTFTFDDTKIPDIDITTEDGQVAVLELFLKTIDNFKQKYCSELRYLVVPELGAKNKRLHFHGLFYIPDRSLLHRVKFNKKTRSNMYRINYFFKKFGANTLYEIKDDTVAISFYCSKYITKSDALQIKSHRYFRSKHLKRDEVVAKVIGSHRITKGADMILSRMYRKNDKEAFENDYVKVFKLDFTEFEYFAQVFRCILAQYKDCVSVRINSFEPFAVDNPLPTLPYQPQDWVQLQFQF